MEDKNCMTIGEGDYFVVDYGSQHSYHAKSDEFELVNCLFLPEFIDASLLGCNSFGKVITNHQVYFNNAGFTANPSRNVYKDEDGSIKRLLLDMVEEFSGEKAGYLQLIRLDIIKILICTIRKMVFSDHSAEEDVLVKKILKHIGREYMNDISLTDICQRYGYTVPYMSVKLKKVLGMTFKEYVQKMRIEQSMRLLANTDKTICEVANEVGYKDLKAFYQVFKRVSGKTPASFKKDIRGCVL